MSGVGRLRKATANAPHSVWHADELMGCRKVSLHIDRYGALVGVVEDVQQLAGLGLAEIEGMLVHSVGRAQQSVPRAITIDQQRCLSNLQQHQSCAVEAAVDLRDLWLHGHRNHPVGRDL